MKQEYVKTDYQIESLTPKDYFTSVLPKFFAHMSEELSQVETTYQFNILGNQGGFWVLDLKKGEIREGTEDTNVVFEIEDQNFVKLTAGTLDVDLALKEADLRVSGTPEEIEFLGRVLSLG